MANQAKKIEINKILSKISEERGAEEWTLSILYASKQKALKSKVHIQKALFLASKYINELKEELEFKAYRLGPYSEEVEDIIEVLESSNYTIKNEKRIVLTSRGLTKAKEIWKKLEEDKKIILKNIVELINNLDEDELLLYIYTKYGFKEKSDIIDKLLRKRKLIALNMLRKGVVSTSLAAKIAGMTLREFIKYAKRKGVKIYTAEDDDLVVTK
ncbi:MAG: UPF0175 family protein [archaeon GB-1867-005]|nr:UPF0175 family protein [Candidatus Culexmicrobium cathedralense]